jgi:FkbM family methyltransferase
MVLRRYISDHHGDEIEMDYLYILVDPLKEAIDVGANFGRYSTRLSSLAKQVWAFEPHPRLVYVLRRALPKNVVVKQAAVSNAVGMITLNVPLRDSRQLESLSTVESVNNSTAHRKIRVPAISLDTFSDRDIGFVKIDVEGHEVDVIRGALRLLAAQQPILLIEADDHHRESSTSDLFTLMSSAGYAGIFWYRDRFHPIDDFDRSTMQDQQSLDPHLPRKKCHYVNNFIFAPKERMTGLCEVLAFKAAPAKAS